MRTSDSSDHLTIITHTVGSEKPIKAFPWKGPNCRANELHFLVEGQLASSGDALLPSTLLIQKSQVPGFDEILLLTPFHLTEV